MAAFATTSPTIGQQFSKLIDVSVVFSMICYVYSSIALIRLRPASAPDAIRDWDHGRGRGGVFGLGHHRVGYRDLLMIAIALALTSIPLYPFYKGRRDTHAAELVGQEAGQGA